MKVFISWSGEPSRSVARVLRDWIPMVVQHVEAWMSEVDIGSGARWNEAIAKALEQTDFGLVCVTADNQAAPWLAFEAGAVAKSVPSGRVVPFCIGLKPSEVTGPLASFQGRQLDQDGLRRVIHDLDTTTDKPMPRERLDQLFDAMWPIFEASLTDATSYIAPSSPKEQRTLEDMVHEVVDSIRRIEHNVFELTMNVSDLGQDVIAPPPSPRPEAEVIDLVAALRASVEAAKKRREDVERAEMKGEDSSEPDE